MAMADDPITAELFSILACPKCRSDLVYSEDKTRLVCTKCSKEYEIKEGIPVLMVK
jgi:uncharacterized protein YbaR (Trm112 family)